MRSSGPAVFAVFLAAAAAAPPALAQQTGERVVRTGTVAEDLYVAGAEVRVDADARGDVVAAGGNVAVDGRVAGDVLAAGGEVEIRGAVADDVRAAGGDVRIEAGVGDEVVAAGGSVTLAEKASAGGRAFLAGGRVEIAGRVGKSLRAGGGSIRLSGEVLGDADLAGERIEIGPGAHVAGNLTYASPAEAVTAPGARIEGKVVRHDVGPSPGARIAGRLFAGLLFVVALAASAAVLYFAFPRFSVGAAQTVGREPWKSLGLGAVVLFGAPVLAVFLGVTVVGLPLAAILAGLYLLALVAGGLTGLIFLADLGLRRAGAKASGANVILALAAVALVLRLLRAVPFLGGFVTFLVLVFGMGALALAAFRVWSRSRAEPPAPARPAAA